MLRTWQRCKASDYCSESWVMSRPTIQEVDSPLWWAGILSGITKLSWRQDEFSLIKCKAVPCRTGSIRGGMLFYELPCSCVCVCMNYFDLLVSTGLCDSAPWTRVQGVTSAGDLLSPAVLNCLRPKLATAYGALMLLAWHWSRYLWSRCIAIFICRGSRFKLKFKDE